MYLRINAIDPTYIGLRDVLINLDTDRIESGTINLYKEGKEISSSIQEYVQFYDTIFAKVVDLGIYEIIDNDNVIIRQEGYVPDFLGINSPAYGDDINFDTDCNGFILKWKEKNIKEQIIEFLQKRLNNE